ncbi:C1 family peptidase [Flavobacterium sp. F-328]|jgi:C1A family cysteine protease|uniref:C1 family peptidase n=1 Tax=Flavobacterium erciyesense TaxID=2825842 RepID=A0ABS5D2G7_9FLAO|nr:C1 family peptidase [Flavobacterium erciyesense]MBQ0908209.1 C1 family peptidase [Flavobacterium erciyesense]
MNKVIKVASFFVFGFLLTGCQNEPIDSGFFNEQNIEVDYSKDPKASGLLESGGCVGLGAVVSPFDYSSLQSNYPNQYDLSNLMPPVSSQGSIGSCTAWATTYYLKSYQEKIQHNTAYSPSTIMSPSYTYNQTKVSNDCLRGSCIISALELLRTKGAISISNFPVSTSSCSVLPNANQNSIAQSNKILSYHNVELRNLSSENEVIEKCKKLIYGGKPLVIGMHLDRKFANAVPRNSNNIFIYNDYNSDFHFGNHAMLITGYDDNLNAFKVVNSWGEFWGNSGYCWISYNFFKSQTSANYQDGLIQVWFTVDA